MIKARLLSLLESMDGPPSFSEYRALLSADILQFPNEARLPSDPGASYGRGWDSSFRLPQSPVGVDDTKSVIVLQDIQPNSIGLASERKFLFIQPLASPMFPVDFYLAWGTCLMEYTSSPPRINAGIAKKGEWFVGKPESEFSDAAQFAYAMRKCESMIGPGLTTAFEQLAYLAVAH